MGRFNKAPYTLTQALSERVKDAIIEKYCQYK